MRLSNVNQPIMPVNISPSYLTNLVKEIIVGSTVGYTAACNQITFDGLDGNADDGYVLECEVVNAFGAKDIHLFCNNDTTLANYYRELFRATGSSTIGYSAADPYVGFALTATSRITCDVSPKFCVRSLEGSVISDNSTDSRTGMTTVIKDTPPTNITRLDLMCADATNVFGVGSKFKLYRKRLNPALILTSRYLSNVVEEKRITTDCSSVTFSGLDSTLDGDYILEFSVVGVASAGSIPIYINNDTTLTNYYREYSQITGSSHNIGAQDGIYSDICSTSANGRTAGTLSIKVVNGKALLKTSYSVSTSSDTIEMDEAVIIYQVSITSITSLNILCAGNYIGAGSTFRLYKTNSASLRPGPSVSAYNSTTQTAATNTDVQLTFSVEEWDTHNCWNGTVFQPTVAGLYQVTFAAQFSSLSSGKVYWTKLYKNGVTYKLLGQMHSAAISDLQIVGTCCVQMNGSTDQLSFVFKHNDSGTVTVNGDPTSTYIQIQKVG